MDRPGIVIVGGGFGGLAAAKALRKTPANITLIDRIITICFSRCCIRLRPRCCLQVILEFRSAEFCENRKIQP